MIAQHAVRKCAAVPAPAASHPGLGPDRPAARTSSSAVSVQNAGKDAGQTQGLRHNQNVGVERRERFDVDRIKRDVDIVALAEQRYGAVIKRRSGRNAICHCIAGTHEDRNPSMTLYADGKGAHCFSCNAHYADVIDLVMQLDHLTFVEACELLERDYLNGSARTADSAAAPRPEPVHAEVTLSTKRVMNAAARHYADELTRQSDARDYLIQNRGLSEATIARMQIGFAAGNTLGRGIYKELAGNLGLLMDVGLMYEPKPGRERVEAMAQRITFPVFGEDGNVIYMLGRATKPGQEPKYLGLADGAVHKAPMVAGGGNTHAIVVEGALDFAALLEWRLDPHWLCVASLGTAQARTIELLARHKVTHCVVMADQDVAGISAGLKLATELAGRGIATRVAVDEDRQAQIETRCADLGADARAALIDARVAPAGQGDLWRAVHVRAEVQKLEAMGWLKAVSWKAAAKDAADLLMFRERGKRMLIEALR